MKNKNRLIKIAVLLAFFLAFAAGQDAFAASKTFTNSDGDQLWSNTDNWDPTGVPDSDDEVVIKEGVTCLVDAGATRACKSLKVGWENPGTASSIKPKDGDTVTLNIYGNLILENTTDDNDAFFGRNGDGRLNVDFKDDAVLTPNGSATFSTGGINFHNVTITNKAVTYDDEESQIICTGNLTMTGTSAFAPNFASKDKGTFTFYEATPGETSAITVPTTSSCEFVHLLVDGEVTTSSNMTIRERLTVNAGDSFIASGGTVTINPVETGHAGYNNQGTLKFYNLKLALSENVTPVSGGESCYVLGDLSKTGTGRFVPAGGTITFDNSEAKSITRNGDGPLSFYDMTITANSSILTTSSMTVTNDMTANGSFSQTSGTFILWGNSGVFDVNVDNGSLGSISVNNVRVKGTTSSPSATTNATVEDMTIGGHFEVEASATFTGDPSSSSNITYDTDGSRRQLINNGGLYLFDLTIPSDSDIETSSSMTFTGGGTDGGGIVNAGTLTQNSGTTTFQGGDTKSISNTGTLQLYDVKLNNVASNKVTTTNDFSVAGTYFECQTNAEFDATAGEITCDNASTTFYCGTAGNLKPHSLKVDGQLVALDQADQMNLSGNLTVNGASGSFTTAYSSGTIVFNGSAAQSITGTGTGNPVMIGVLEVDNSSGVTLGINTKVFNSGQLRLTNGTIDLATKTLSVGGTISYTSGKINGNTGTYEMFGAHNGSGNFKDEIFTPSSDPTLYNLTVNYNDNIDGYVTVNGDLTLNTSLTYTGQTLDVYGDVTRLTSTTASKLVHGGSGKLILSGSGEVEDLSNSYFLEGYAWDLQLNRAEELAAELDVNNMFTLNTGVEYFDLDQYRFDLSNPGASITLISGSVTAGTNSEVSFGAIDLIPANFFTNNQAYKVTLNNATTLGGDLEVTGSLSFTAGNVQNITTGDENTLTIGDGATIPTFTPTAHVIGNLERTVTNTSTTFNIGGGTAPMYRPIALQFETAGNSQKVKVSSEIINPTYSRGGSPENAVQLLWTLTPSGTAPTDDLKIDLSWRSTYDGDKTAAANKTFLANWTGSAWTSYYDYASFTSGNPRRLQMSSYAVDASDLSGAWAVFTADNASKASADDAIAVTFNKLVFKELTPNPVNSGSNFRATIQLQDQNGDPISVTAAHTVDVTKQLGTNGLDAPATRSKDITVGNSSVIFDNLSISTGSGETGIQLIASTTPPSGTVQSGVSEQISVIGNAPGDQASNLSFSSVSATSMNVSWSAPSSGEDCLLMGRATSAIDTHPTDGTTYIDNTNYGIGSTVGDAVVLYKGGRTSVDVTGLAPNTTYYFSVYAYAGTEGNENYLTDPGVSNFNQSQATIGTNNDDTEFGSNDTRATAAAIGTNTPIKGTIEDATDVDWFSFTITNGSPNVRGRILNLPKNYNIEFYDSNGNRIRRAIRPGTNNEAFVVNYLDPGTYTVKVYGVNSAYDNDYYTLLITTMSSEIFSVTP